MLDIDKIRQLVEMMVTNELVEISLRDGEEEVNLRRPSAPGCGVTVEPGLPSVIQSPLPGAVPQPASTQAPPTTEPVKADSDDDLVAINSPMVGTFYSATDPESPPFVKVGQQLSVGTVVCIVEAMKVFNELKSEVAGTLEQILVKNSQPLEYGQPMFLVRPA